MTRLNIKTSMSINILKPSSILLAASLGACANPTLQQSQSPQIVKVEYSVDDEELLDEATQDPKSPMSQDVQSLLNEAPQQINRQEEETQWAKIRDYQWESGYEIRQLVFKCESELECRNLEITLEQEANKNKPTASNPLIQIYDMETLRRIHFACNERLLDCIEANIK